MFNSDKVVKKFYLKQAIFTTEIAIQKKIIQNKMKTEVDNDFNDPYYEDQLMSAMILDSKWRMRLEWNL